MSFPTCTSNGSVGLCTDCRDVLLLDNSEGFEVEIDEAGSPNLSIQEVTEIATKYALVDRLPNLPRLQASADQGCQFCAFLRRALLSRETSQVLRRYFTLEIETLRQTEMSVKIAYQLNCPVMTREEYSSRNQMQILVTIAGRVGDGHTEFSIFCAIEATAADDVAAKWLNLEGPSAPTYADEKSVQWMKSKLESCVDHDHMLPTALGFAPEFLVDVQGHTSKLVNRNDLPIPWETGSQLPLETPRYTALSYSWGTAKDSEAQLKATQDSIPKLTASIGGQELTPVLRDAIQITKALSIPYLWVDALCILQDDISNWERQCEEMDKIYGHAHVTIVAASSQSCQEGFLQTNTNRICIPFQSAIYQHISGSFDIIFKAVDKSHSHEIYASYFDVAECYLSTRGWAIQEPILSTRQIVFGVFNVHFSCSDEHESRGQPPCGGGLGDTIEKVRREDGHKELYSSWIEILKNYKNINPTSFSYPTDLFPSISGLASYFGKRLEDDYWAGYWKRDIHAVLLWGRIGNKPLKVGHIKQLSSLVPSWSQLWKGNVDDVQGYLNQSLNPEVENIDAEIKIRGDNPYGTIENARLVVCSHIMNLKSNRTTKFVPMVSLGAYTEYSVGLRFWDGKTVHCWVWLDYNVSGAEFSNEVMTWDWILLASCKLDDSGASDASDNREERQPCGLLLNKINDKEWCRVGAFFPGFGTWWEGGARLSLHDFQQASEIKRIVIV